MKGLKKRLATIFAAFILFSLTIVYMENITQLIANTFWLRPGVIEAIALTFESKEITQDEATRQTNQAQILLGNLLQRKAIESPDVLPIYGSSELTVVDPQFGPMGVFARKPSGFFPFVVGRGFCENLIHVLNISSLNKLKNRDLLFTFAPDWFGSKNGISNNHFAMNSSPLKVYQVLFNRDLPQPLKQHVISRIQTLPAVIDGDIILSKFLMTYSAKSLTQKLEHIVLWPLARVDLAALQVQDALQVEQIVSKLKPNMINLGSTQSPEQIDWQKLHNEAVSFASKRISNKLNIYDDSPDFKRYTRPSMQGSEKKVSKLNSSREYDDFQLLLDILKTKGAKATFIMFPYSGLYRDFTGLSPTVRQEYYTKIRQMVADAGFRLIDLSNHEEDIYYFEDPAHPSPVGWVGTDKLINALYGKNQ
ncbi:putative Protein DltD [Candidatus Desulfosporosinus infrequens]|uniref:D-alanyl-lipoteichoic acid biosynthesis protein DltD n=1 Tax=Candidatus Desulfosporosinus infrequens TaxID=2043169 RepID=A0A2U3KH37_9FIRM|nr:putative Protein DltD [Candidatus Desulfosporosinus infrequens]